VNQTSPLSTLPPLALALALFAASGAHAAKAAARPGLAVLVVVDQLRAADVDRLAPLFGDGGLGGLERRGAHVDLRYPFAVTETGPGHATIATGADPTVHCITANRWWRGAERVYCVADPAGHVFGTEEGAPGLGPANLRAGTLADALKVATNGKARVVTLSHKDRAAILTGGFSADVAAWYDAKLGRFTTSARYGKALPAWLEKRARARVQASLADSAWPLLPHDERHACMFPDDDAVGEDAHFGGRTFPHDVSAAKDDAARLRDYRGTPQALADIFALAGDALEQEQLGADDAPDLLVIGVSSADFVGHWFGPDSVEMVDVLRRLDRELRTFADVLDARYGRSGYVLAVTGDHGGLPLPERTSALGVPGGRIPARAIFDGANEAIAQALPKADKRKWLVGFQSPHLWLDLEGLTEADRDVALEAARKSIASHEGVAGAWRSDRLRGGDDAFAQQMLAVRHEGRTGQLFLRTRPRWFIDYSGEGTDHGSPYAYDTRVPLFLVGSGVVRGHFATERDPRDVAPTIAWLLGMPPPDAAQGRPIDFALRWR
jgi:predicted AlkP superfamily pyrophosphatase or phosphodiesterase